MTDSQHPRAVNLRRAILPYVNWRLSVVSAGRMRATKRFRGGMWVEITNRRDNVVFQCIISVEEAMARKPIEDVDEESP